MPQPYGSESVVSDIDISKPISLKRITKKATLELERQIILKVLRTQGWNRQKTAKWLQMSYRSLLYKLNEVTAAGLPNESATVPAMQNAAAEDELRISAGPGGRA
jgi:two-component system response regulator AtoC